MNEFSRPRFNEWCLADGLAGPYPPIDEAECRIVAIGNFDGAHRGHAAVAGETRALAALRADGRRGRALALTFEPHPRQVFQPGRPHFRLLAPEDRARRLAGIGFDGAFVLPFTSAFAGLSPEAFIAEILVARIGVAGVVVGQDFHFGKARAGTPAFLAAEGARLGFAVRLVAPYRDADGTVISSSAIRAALGIGDVPRANAMLGYRFSVRAAVVHGAKRGRELGYPTANMRLDPGFALAHGIYAVRVTAGGRDYPGVASFGTRPQFDDGAPLLETHLFDFSDDLYGQMLEIGFVAYLRGEAKFASLDALIAQMAADCAAARRILADPAMARPR